jgi:hypothetical protein
MDDPGTQSIGWVRQTMNFRFALWRCARIYLARYGAASVEPLMRLMVGILIDAMRCLQRNFEAHQPNRRKEFKKAQPGCTALCSRLFTPSQRKG